MHLRSSLTWSDLRTHRPSVEFATHNLPLFSAVWHFCKFSNHALHVLWSSKLYRLLWIWKMKETLLSFTMQVKTPKCSPLQHSCMENGCLSTGGVLVSQARILLRMDAWSSTCQQPGSSKIGQRNFSFLQTVGRVTNNRHNLFFFFVGHFLCCLTCLFL